VSGDTLAAWIGLVGLAVIGGILLYMKTAFGKISFAPVARYLDGIGIILIGLLGADALGLFRLESPRGAQLAIDLVKAGAVTVMAIGLFRFRHTLPWQTRGMVYVSVALAIVVIGFVRSLR